MTQSASLFSACRDFFEKEPLGRKLEIAEYKALTREDKVQLAEWLSAEGYEVTRELAAAA